MEYYNEPAGFITAKSGVEKRILQRIVDKHWVYGIENTLLNKEAIDDFSVAVTYDEIKEKNNSLSGGQYFDIKIDYVDITEEGVNKRMADYKQTLAEQFAESHKLEKESMEQLNSLVFNLQVGQQ